MATPYGIDYLKNLVSSSLGSNQPGEGGQEDDSASEGGANGPSSYGMDSGMSAGGGMGGGMGGAGLGGSPYGGMGGGEAMESRQMGPNFQNAASLGGIGRAALGVGADAAHGLDTLLPGASDALQGAAAMAGKHRGSSGPFENAGPPKNMPEYLSRLAHFESGGNPLAYNKGSGASGLFQYLDSTWNNYGGYKSAKDAPVSVQYKRAMEDTVDRLNHNGGDLVKATLTHFLGAKGLQQKLQNPQKLYEPVNALNGNVTPISYGTGILGNQVVKDWANNHHSMIGMNTGAQTQPYNLPANGMASPPLAQSSQ